MPLSLLLRRLAWLPAGLLVACAQPNLPPGSTAGDVMASMGKATYQCPLPDGGERLIWSQQPMGQYAWATNLNAAGISDGVVPILTDAAFDQVKTGTWTADRLRCTFGPPAEIQAVGLPSVRQTTWAYRYRQDHSWNSLMYFYLDKNGHVTRMHPGPDPMFDPREMPGFL